LLILVGLSLVLAGPGQAQRGVGERDSTAARHTPGGAFWRSILLPGWGQWYNGRPIKGSIYAGLTLVCAGMAIRNWDRALGSDEGGSLFWSRQAWAHGRNNWLILGGTVYLLGAVDAYVDAHLQTFDVGPISLAVLPKPGGGVAMVAVLTWSDRKQIRR